MRRIVKYAVPMPLAAMLLFSSATLGAEPTIEAVGTGYGYAWSPSSADVAPGGSVVFTSSSGTIPHGIAWKSGPETPKCSGVPIDDGKTSWSGSCTFAQAGTYDFVCYVHPDMAGKVTAGSTTTPPPPATPGTPGTSDKVPALESLKLARGQQGTAVRGSVEISEAGTGSRLRIDLYAPRAVLFGPGHAGKARAGGFRRASWGAGIHRFRVPLTPAARKALRGDGRLTVQVKIAIIATDGTRERRTREVTLHV